MHDPTQDEEIVTPRASMRDWTRDRDGHLHGRVYGRRGFADGTEIVTTMVNRQYRSGDRLLAQAMHTLYELTGPDGEPWFVHTGRTATAASARTPDLGVSHGHEL